MSKVVLFDSENCFVCNDYMGPFRNQLTSSTDLSETPIYTLLESLLDTQITRKIRLQSAICQECFIKISKYDDLLRQSQDIQQNLFSLFHNLSIENDNNTEFIGIKIENSESSMRIRCEKCQKSFSSLHQLENHKECSQKRIYAKSMAIDSSKISKEFLELAEHNGVAYDYEKFQQAFYTENEKMCTEPRARKQVVRSAKVEKISNNFKDYTETNGIDYNPESFKKAFDGGKRSNDKTAASSLQLAPSFVKEIESQGINYNLETFQKVFGFHNTPEFHFKVALQADKSKKSTNRKIDGNVKCSKCDEKFKTRVEFLNHIKTHKKEEIYCKKCNRDFKTKLCLELHYATDHDKQQNGPFPCSMCPKSFTEKKNLRSHLYTHGSERKFFCDRCGADFLHKKSFDMHILVHDDIRPFQCHLCNKRFRTKSKVVVHMRVHTGEKKYECPYCPGKRFRQKWGMDLHIKKAHSTGIQQDAVECQICKVNLHKSKLRQHLNNVHHVANAQQYGDFE